MKKSCILCLSLASMLILTMVNCTNVYGQTQTVLKIVPWPVVVIEGKNFTVSIDVYNVVGMQSFQFKVSWDPNFLDYVSHMVSPPWPPPVIILDPIVDWTSGYIVIGATSLTAAFTGSGTLATITFHALKSGTTYVTISESVILPDPIILLTEGASVFILPINTWVSLAGKVSSYGTNHAHGWISIFAEVENWADGWCAFTVPPLGGPIILIYPPPTFDFTLYAAKLVNASIVKLNHNASDFWISGFWGVSNATNPRDIRDIAMLVKHYGIVAPGEFSVKGNWSYFTLNIQGFESIQGNVTSYCIRKIDDIYGRLPYADINRDYKIDIKDIATFAKSFGSMLGFDRYQLYADINFDLQVDIRDIAQCAQGFGKEY